MEFTADYGLKANQVASRLWLQRGVLWNVFFFWNFEIYITFVSNCKMYLSQIAKYIRLMLQNIFVSNSKMFLIWQAFLKSRILHRWKFWFLSLIDGCHHHICHHHIWWLPSSYLPSSYLMVAIIQLSEATRAPNATFFEESSNFFPEQIWDFVPTG